MFSVFVLTFVLGFLVLKLLTPRLYEHQFRTDFKNIVTTLVNEVSDTGVEELDYLISEFAYEHHADVVLKKGEMEIIANFHVWEIENNHETLRFNTTQEHGITGELFSLQVISSITPITLALSIMFSVWHGYC